MDDSTNPEVRQPGVYERKLDEMGLNNVKALIASAMQSAAAKLAADEAKEQGDMFRAFMGALSLQMLARDTATWGASIKGAMRMLGKLIDYCIAAGVPLPDDPDMAYLMDKLNAFTPPEEPTEAPPAEAPDEEPTVEGVMYIDMNPFNLN